MSRNFFEEFAKNDFFEKKASENENIKNTLGSITPSVLEKLAEEIGAISDEEDMTLEQKLASEEEEKEEEKEEKEAESEEKEEAKEETKEEKEAEPEEKEEAEEEKEAEPEEKEEAEEEEKEAEPEEKEEAEEEKEAEPEEKEEAKEEEKEEPKEDKEAAGCSEDEVKQAYEIAEQKLASAGLTVADYVYEKTASESTALFVSENAEKLASLSDKSTLQVADEILSAMAEKLG